MCGIDDDAFAPKDAVSLNNLDDRYEFHQAVLKWQKERDCGRSHQSISENFLLTRCYAA
jgi:hypothetical protein